MRGSPAPHFPPASPLPGERAPSRQKQHRKHHHRVPLLGVLHRRQQHASHCDIRQQRRLQRHPPPRQSHHGQPCISKIYQPQPHRNRAVPRMIRHHPPPDVQRKPLCPRPQPHIRNPPHRQNNVVGQRPLADPLCRQRCELRIQLRCHRAIPVMLFDQRLRLPALRLPEQARAGTSSTSISPLRFQKTVPASTKFTDQVRIQRKKPAGTNSPGLFTYRGASG